MLYFHETVEIVGDGQAPYLESVGSERAAHCERLGMSRLVGSWEVVSSTHRWPQVVNLWEMDGWEQWAGNLERHYVPEKRDPQLGAWWTQATRWCRGGRGQLLEPAPYSPTREDLRQQRLKAWVCIQAAIRLLPGRTDEYLDAVGKTLRPLLAEHGISLVGAYSAPLRSDEALVLWAAPDFRSLCRVYAERSTDPGLRGWTELSASLRRELDTMWLVPSTHSFFHPRR